MSQTKTFLSDRLTVRCHLQHYLNPLHFYCRLRDWGIPTRFASRLCGRYERLYRLFFRTEPATGD